MVNRAAEQASGASQAPALMTNGWKRNAVACGRIPNELITFAVERPLALWRFEHHQMRFIALHAAGRTGCASLISLRIVEFGVLAIWRLARFATPEVT